MKRGKHCTPGRVAPALRPRTRNVMVLDYFDDRRFERMAERRAACLGVDFDVSYRHAMANPCRDWRTEWPWIPGLPFQSPAKKTFALRYAITGDRACFVTERSFSRWRYSRGEAWRTLWDEYLRDRIRTDERNPWRKAHTLDAWRWTRSCSDTHARECAPFDPSTECGPATRTRFYTWWTCNQA